MQLGVHPHEGFLRGVFSLGRVTQHAVAQIVHRPLICLHQTGKCRLIATPGLLQPEKFLVFHLNLL